MRKTCLCAPLVGWKGVCCFCRNNEEGPAGPSVGALAAQGMVREPGAGHALGGEEIAQVDHDAAAHRFFDL